MTHKDAYYWHSKGKFVKENPAELLAIIVRHDNSISRNLSFRAQRDLKTLDELLAFFIELLQIIHKNRESWQSNAQARASVAMATAALNHHILARHAVILGYSAEANMLYRGCFERMTRTLFFQIDEESANRFWKGELINQSEVNAKISQYLETKNEGVDYKEIYQSYKNTWSMLSQLSHPNLDTLKFRTMTVDGRSVTESLGVDAPLGGMSDEIVIFGMVANLAHLNFSLSLMKILVREFLGKWNNKLDKKLTRLTIAGFDVSLGETERQIEGLKQGFTLLNPPVKE